MQKFTGKQYLKIAVANAYGLDKSNWNDRINWFNVNKERLHTLLPEAEEPAMMYAAMQAVQRADSGEACGFPITLDATASGLQILSIIAGDQLAASLCNVIDVDSRQDAYTAIYEYMDARFNIGDKIDREDLKRAVMTSLYGSLAVPKEVFGPLHPLFEQVMVEVAPKVWSLNQTFLNMWNPTKDTYHWELPDGFNAVIKVMDKVKETFHFDGTPREVEYYVHQPMEEGRSLGANVTHSIDGMVVREMVARCNYDEMTVQRIKDYLRGDSKVISIPSDYDNYMVKKLWNLYKKSGFFSSRMIEFLNQENIHMIEEDVLHSFLASLPAKPFDIIAIHDCFRVLPNYGNDLRQQYNNILSELADSKILQFLFQQILENDDIEFAPNTKEFVDAIKVANYALS